MALNRRSNKTNIPDPIYRPRTDPVGFNLSPFCCFFYMRVYKWAILSAIGIYSALAAFHRYFLVPFHDYFKAIVLLHCIRVRCNKRFRFTKYDKSTCWRDVPNTASNSVYRYRATLPTKPQLFFNPRLVVKVTTAVTVRDGLGVEKWKEQNSVA